MCDLFGSLLVTFWRTNLSVQRRQLTTRVFGDADPSSRIEERNLQSTDYMRLVFGNNAEGGSPYHDALIGMRVERPIPVVRTRLA